MRPYVFIAIIAACLQNFECQNYKAVNSRLNFFDVELLQHAAQDKSGNVMVSPVSIRSTLAVLLEGAMGETAWELRNALRLPPIREEQRNQMRLYVNALQSYTPDVSLENANAIFVNKNLKMKKTFENIVDKVYNSEISSLDFKYPNAASHKMNEWVKKNTKGLIPTVVESDQINPLTEIFVANALYFKSLWKTAFTVRNRVACFYAGNDCIKVSMMETEADLRYLYVPSLRTQVVEIPYQNDRYTMTLLVPQDRDGLSLLLRDLLSMSLAQMSEMMEITEVRLSMPRFNIDYAEDMVDVLKGMRIKTLFDTSSNLTGIFEGTQPHVSNIYHKVHMDVNENGTAAAAATVVHVVPLINSGVELRVDRPFLFFIRDKDLGITLFEGKIEAPVEYVDQIELKRGPTTAKPKVFQSLSSLPLNSDAHKSSPYLYAIIALIIINNTIINKLL